MLAFPAPSWGIPVADEQPQPPSPTKADAASPRYGRTASLIVPRLYLSDYYTAQDEAELSKLCITHVLSVTDMNPVLPEMILTENRLHVRLADRSDVDILSHLGKTTAFIRNALDENEENRVLVHCVQGISRSATVVCAFLLATTSMIPTEAIEFVQSKRGIVCPNLGFRQQLDTYALQFDGKRPIKPAKRPFADRVSDIGGSLAHRIRMLKIRGDLKQSP